MIEWCRDDTLWCERASVLADLLVTSLRRSEYHSLASGFQSRSWISVYCALTGID